MKKKLVQSYEGSGFFFFLNVQVPEKNGKMGPFSSVLLIQTEYLKLLRICNLIYISYIFLDCVKIKQFLAQL